MLAQKNTHRSHWRLSAGARHGRRGIHGHWMIGRRYDFWTRYNLGAGHDASYELSASMVSGLYTGTRRTRGTRWETKALSLLVGGWVELWVRTHILWGSWQYEWKNELTRIHWLHSWAGCEALVGGGRRFCVGRGRRFGTWRQGKATLWEIGMMSTIWNTVSIVLTLLTSLLLTTAGKPLNKLWGDSHTGMMRLQLLQSSRDGKISLRKKSMKC